MKIAILGSAPSSVSRAPFKNKHYAEWSQGKAPDLAVAHAQIPMDQEWDIWGCSPGCWAVAPRAARWYEIHRWEPGQAWFSPDYCNFLRSFKGPVYTGGSIPEIPNHVIYPIDDMEEKFGPYFFTSSISQMMALAIDEIEKVRECRAIAKKEGGRHVAEAVMPKFVDKAELDKEDKDDVIGLWGIDMAAAEEYGYQRPGCQFFLLEAYRRGIGVYVPPESDLLRPMPVYGISEWDHNYIKLTARSREHTAQAAHLQQQIQQHQQQLAIIQGAVGELNGFVQTWTSPYGWQPGIVVRHEPGTGLGGGINHLDSRPVTRMVMQRKQEQWVPHPVNEAKVIDDPSPASIKAAEEIFDLKRKLAKKVRKISHRKKRR